MWEKQHSNKKEKKGIEDKANKLAFFLAGTILVNKNETFNNETYEFEEKGIPFLAEVGRQLYLNLKNNRH